MSISGNEKNHMREIYNWRINMYHPYSKNDPHVRKALYEIYAKKCFYCGDLIKPKNMHVDHILATNSQKENDTEFNQYLNELLRGGFVLDCIENYLPTCAACNLTKSNRNFSVANLRFFHGEAKKRADKILREIKKYNNQQISFDEYDPDYDYWEKIDFSYQKDISEAIAGYRLQPCHVIACPRLPQVEGIKKRLGVVDYVIVEGEPGCGKSISVYQVAFDLSLQGYTIYRYINKNAEDTILVPQSDDKKYLVIIDDAQNLPQFSLENVLSQSQRKTKIILAFTKLEKGKPFYSEPIRLTNHDAVNAIAKDYKKRKSEILPIVQHFDKSVGDGMLDVPFESRIKNAAIKETPWLFNYTLRGGWSTINEQFQSVYNHNNCGLLCTIIALFQILKKDSSIDFTWLQSYIQEFDKNISWAENDLEYLINYKMVVSFDDVRIVHIESARKIIRCFFVIGNENCKTLFCRILEKSYGDRYYDEQGLIWLQSVVSSYFLEERVFTDSLLSSVFSNLDTVNDEERRGFIVYFLERMFHLHRERNGRYYFEQNKQDFANWVSSATSKNVYAYSQLINALNNERNDSLKRFVSKIDILSLMRGFDDSTVDNLYAWSCLFNRLSCAYENESIKQLGDMLRKPLIAKSQSVSEKNVGMYYSSLSHICFINPELIIELLARKIDVFQHLWLFEPEEALYTLDFDFLGYVCGISLLSTIRPSKEQRTFTKHFVKTLPVKPVAEYISHSLPRDWHNVYYLGLLLYRENKRKYGEIIKSLELDFLSKTTGLLWKKTNGDLHLLFSFIANGDYSCAQSFFEANKDRIEEIGVAFIELLPQQTIELHKKRVKCRLFENSWNDITLKALMALHESSENDYQAILDSEVMQLVNKISDFCILDFDKHDREERTLFDITVFLKETYPEILIKTVSLLDFSNMKKNKLSMQQDSRYDRKCKNRFNDMINILIECSDENSIRELQSLKSFKK